MLYYGPVDSHGTGRNSVAREMLGKLEKRMAVTGQTFGQWSRVLSDGTRVTVWITKAGTHPLYRAKIVTPQRKESQPSVFMESGFMQKNGRLEFFDPKMYYTQELVSDLAILNAGPGTSWLDWLDAELSSTSRVYTPGMPSLAVNTSDRQDDVSYGFNHSSLSGKASLVFQAMAGTRNTPVEDYAGDVLP